MLSRVDIIIGLNIIIDLNEEPAQIGELWGEFDRLRQPKFQNTPASQATPRPAHQCQLVITTPY